MSRLNVDQITLNFLVAGLFLFFATSTTFAQSKRGNDSKALLGVRIGANFADVNIPGYNGVQSLISPPRTNTSFVFGGILNIKLSDRLSLQNELVYLQKGFKAEDAVFDQILGQNLDIDIGATARTSLSYLEFAPTLKYLFNSEKSFKPYVSVGPYVGYALSGNIRSEVNIIIANIPLSRTDLNLQNDIYNRLDVGLIGGFGVQANFGAGFAFTDLQFGYSLTTTIDNSTLGIKMKNFGARWGIGVAFYL